MSGQNPVEVGIELAAKAIAADGAQRWAEAVTYYSLALKAFAQASQSNTLSLSLRLAFVFTFNILPCS